ncbi:HipA family kinase [Niallia oryzisoli]|uniref:HipA family kinase n=1 Tax=Niallia oryzisoli TaxID=1737571 RepID=A0ABZ2CAL3_9BACI
MYEKDDSIKLIRSLPGDMAQLFQIGRDKHLYVMKFNNVYNRTKEVVNEYIVGKLAEKLGLPVLPVKPVYVTQSYLKQLKIPGTAGFQLSLPYIENCLSFNEFIKQSQKEVVNKEDLSGMIVFDQWVNNTDRSRTNILFQPQGSGYRFLMIDHGRCFPGGYLWTVDSLSEEVQYRINMPVYKWATSSLTHENELRLFAQKILSLDKNSISEIIMSVPKDWIITAEEKKQLLHFLTKQQQALPNVIENYIQRYRH